jgi:predicted nucleic acid-binding protein
VTAVFADSSYYIALLLKADQMHSRAMELARHFSVTKPPIVTTAWVLTEVANTCSAPRLRSDFLALLDDVRASTGVVIAGSDLETFNQGIDFFRNRVDKDWSLTDCISFVVMEREGITEALTADRDFEQAGFKALMR